MLCMVLFYFELYRRCTDGINNLTNFLTLHDTWGHWQANFVPHFILCLLLNAGLYQLPHHLLPNYDCAMRKGRRAEGRVVALETPPAPCVYINQRPNKLKAKWLLALDIYHRGKANEGLYTPEDRGMLLFITVICGQLSCCWSWNRPV